MYLYCTAIPVLGGQVVCSRTGTRTVLVVYSTIQYLYRYTDTVLYIVHVIVRSTVLQLLGSTGTVPGTVPVSRTPDLEPSLLYVLYGTCTCRLCSHTFSSTQYTCVPVGMMCDITHHTWMCDITHHTWMCDITPFLRKST